MIADGLKRAFEDKEKAREKFVCIREPNFQEMYEARESPMEQERIRKANPESHHCHFLKKASDACDRFPEAVGTARVGGPCPNNPLERDAELFSKCVDDEPLVYHAHTVGDMVELGLVIDPEKFEPEDYTVALFMRRRQRLEELKALQMGLATMMFGAGGKGDGGN